MIILPIIKRLQKHYDPVSKCYLVDKKLWEDYDEFANKSITGTLRGDNLKFRGKLVVLKSSKEEAVKAAK